MSVMTERAQRRARVRRGVATGAVALFLASFGAIATWGRQPAAKVASAPAPQTDAQPQVEQPPPDPGYGYDPYGYDDDPYGDESETAPPQDQGDAGPAPMTTRQS